MQRLAEPLLLFGDGIQMYKIMIVEDEPPIARYLCRLFEQFKGEYEVAAVGSNGQEGLELFISHQPDIVITDVRMPMMNGLQLIKRIKSLDSKVQFLIISDYQDFEYARDGLHLGVHNYLIKPVTSEQLSENLLQLKKIIDEERKEDGHRILQDILNGQMESDTAKLLQRQASRWQLVLVQCGCVMNSRMKYLIQPEDNPDIHLPKITRMVSMPDKAVAWTAENDNNTMIFLWNAEDVLFNEKMILYDDKGIFWTVVCSEVFEDLTKIPTIYSNCSKILYYRTVIGENQYLNYSKSLDLEQPYIFMAEQEMEFIQAVKMNSFDLLKNALIYAFAEMERIHIPQYILENQLQRFFFIIADRRTITMEQQQEGLAEIIYFSRNMAAVLGGILDLLMTGWEFGGINSRNRSKGQQMMESIDQYIDSHLNEIFSLQDLSEPFSLSKTYICRLFRDYKGMSFKDYIIGIKIDKAKELLLKGENVKNVSEYLGYIDQFYFSKVFKKRIGVTPSEYIRNARV